MNQALAPRRFIHFSVDDTFDSLIRLADDASLHLFEEPTFAFLRHLHERYGARVTLYVFLERHGRSLHEIPARCMDAFQQATWLRLAFHGGSHHHPLPSPRTPNRDVRRALRETHDEIARFAGARSIDATLRLHRFAGPRNAVVANGIVPTRVLLTPDDDREHAYDLQPRERDALADELETFDERTGLLFLPSLTRIEHEARPDGMIERWLQRVAEARPRHAMASLFTHEPHLQDPEIRRRIERAMMSAVRWRVEPAFHTDLIEIRERRMT